MEVKQDNREQKRVNTIKQRYGQNAFKEWGARGGNPVLKLQKEAVLNATPRCS